MTSQSVGGDRGVSQVLGNLLLVAIVVILSALVGPFAYNMAQQVSSSPPAAVFGFQEADGTGVIITYEQGRDIETENLRLEGTDPDGNVAFGPWPTDGTLSTGDQINVTTATGNETFRIVWSDGGKRSYILTERTL